MSDAAHKTKGQSEVRKKGQMNFMFNCQGESVKLFIDRENKSVKLTSSQTNYQEQDMEWNMLWDKGKEEEQNKVAEGLSDEEFRNLFIKQMALNGYQLVKSS